MHNLPTLSSSSNLPLIIASNRDETFDRPTESMKLRTQKSNKSCTVQEENDEKKQQQHHRRRGRRRSSLAGKDLVGGGTWLAIDVSSAMQQQQQQTELDGGQNLNDASAASTPSLPRWIAITNFRDHEEPGRPSRGGLLTDYIENASKAESLSESSSSESSEEELQSAQEFVSNLQHVGHEYNGFNMLVGDESGIYYYGNRMHNDDDNHAPSPATATDDGEPLRPLSPGIYGLSNALLDTPWPKVERGKELLEQLLQREQHQTAAQRNNDSNDKDTHNSSLKQLHEELMTILTDTKRPASDSSLPNTGIGLENERFLSSIFIPPGIFMGKEYGTRSSTSVIVDLHGNVSVLERTWYPVDQEDEWFYFHQ